MKKLKSTTDFALEQKRPIPGSDLGEADYYHQEYEVLEKIVNHAKFLKQEINIGMFVPCVNNEPLDKFIHNIDSKEMSQDWEKAKEKVLFKGFEIVEISKNLKIVINTEKDCQVFASVYGKPFYRCKEFGIIEDLIKYELELIN